MRHGDPIQELDHTHEHLSALVVALARIVATDRPSGVRLADRRRELVKLAEELRDELFAHFAREEEGLFPYVREKLPGDEVNLVERLVKSHDDVCRTVLRLVELAHESDADALRAAFEAFNDLYALHSNDEAELLKRLEGGLDAVQRQTLHELVRGL